MSSQPIVYLVEDDQGVATALTWMLSGLRVEVRPFAKPSTLLLTRPPQRCSCLVVDLQLPEMNGLKLLEHLRAADWHSPFIIITGCGEVPDAVSAMQQGAVDFIQKPLDRDSFLASVRRALERDAERRDRDQQQRLAQAKLNRLTPRETQVLALIVEGKRNRAIALELGVALKTVETHRSSLTQKLEVDSVAQLVRLVLETQT